MPLAGTLAGPRLAAPLLLVIDFVTTLGLLPASVKRVRWREVLTMIAGAAVGAPLGARVLATADPLAIRWSIALLVAALLALLASGWRYRSVPSLPATLGVGGAAGFLSGLAQAGGPPVVAFWLGGAVPAPVVRANIIVYFALSSLLAFASYYAAGLLVPELVPMALTAGPAYGLGLWLGSRGFALAGETTFRRICYGLIALAALVSLPLLDPWLRPG